jgi:hypothetical protein
MKLKLSVYVKRKLDVSYHIHHLTFTDDDLLKWAQDYFNDNLANDYDVKQVDIDDYEI